VIFVADEDTECANRNNEAGQCAVYACLLTYFSENMNSNNSLNDVYDLMNEQAHLRSAL